MISLTANVGLHESLLAVDHPEQASLDDVFKIGSELVVVRGAPSAGGKLLVGRGFLGTPRAAHLDGASLVAFSLDSGVTVTGSQGGSVAATSISMPGTVTDLGGGVAEVLFQPRVARVVLTNADILAMRTAPAEILAPTETLGYSGSPTTLPVPIWGFVQIEAADGNYANVPNPLSLLLAWGADWSMTAARTQEAGNTPLDAPAVSNAFAFFASVTPHPKSFLMFAAADGDVGSVDGTLQDNGLYLTFTGDGGGGDTTGNMSGGNAANKIIVTVAYVVVTFS